MVMGYGCTAAWSQRGEGGVRAASGGQARVDVKVWNRFACTSALCVVASSARLISLRRGPS